MRRNWPPVIIALGILVNAGCGADKVRECPIISVDAEVSVLAVNSILNLAEEEGVLAGGAVCLAIRDASGTFSADTREDVHLILTSDQRIDSPIISVTNCELQMQGQLILGIYFPSQAESSLRSSLLWLGDVVRISKSKCEIVGGVHVAPLSSAGYQVTLKRDKNTGKWSVENVEQTWIS